MIIELDAQEYKDILSTVDLYKEGVSVETSGPYEVDNGIFGMEQILYINNTAYMFAKATWKEDSESRKYQYYFLQSIPPEYQKEAPFVATLEVDSWDALKNVLVAAGAAK